MANCCDTLYKITGSRKAVNDLWTTLQNMEVNSKNIWLDDLAKFYGIDYEKRHISVRGHIYYSALEVDADGNRDVLTIETDTAWTGCHDLFRAIGEVLWNELNISYREIESGCEIYAVHDEENFFPEECCVDAYGEIFDDVCSDVYDTVENAIKVWCERTGQSQGGRTIDEMLDYINDFVYDDVDTYFYINRFTHE